MATSAPTSNGTHHQNVVPSEVGWQFVPQYYTFVNKEPHRLHCFYNKTSTFIHGTEGEEIKPCYGQQEIHKKITSIGFQDCKVFIHSVDAQSSANGGIIIQVIGEMSNRSEPWRKFVQTFFLAEQPNGYFVLNDIFRFLKEESVEGDEYSEAGEATEAAPVTLAQEVPAPEPTYEAPREPTPPPAPASPEPVAAPAVPEPPKETVEPTPAPAPEPPAPVAAPPANGSASVEAEKPATPAPAEKAPEPAPPAPAAQSTPTAAPPAAATPSAAPPPQQPAQAAQPPQPAAPPAPKTWASLAASNQKKWGSVAQEARGISEAPAAVTTSAPGSGTQTPSQGNPQGRPNQPRGHPAVAAAQGITIPQCFIKGVVEPITDAGLNATLARFGPIKELDIVRSKACAFLEYQSLDSAKRAIIASLNQGAGGEGGVFVETEQGNVRIFVETKKERSDRPPAGHHSAAGGSGRGRGVPPTGGDRGGFRGGRGGQRGRGAPPAAAPK
ncbi:hypothetical protein BKA70DRAFT_1246057 [Coprinopsis sp. MPI-PUGE-AT-0042]|nr:hypothetical protein BKA70DRAFT_1246057 [Coprinopsis sp. MPI-PUGE-AT-0042]